jgi:hypothetical protein
MRSELVSQKEKSSRPIVRLCFHGFMAVCCQRVFVVAETDWPVPGNNGVPISCPSAQRCLGSGNSLLMRIRFSSNKQSASRRNDWTKSLRNAGRYAICFPASFN